MKILKKVSTILLLMLIVFLFGTIQSHVKETEKELLFQEVQEMINQKEREINRNMLGIDNMIIDRVELIEFILGVDDE